jgi:predicted permease
LVVAEVGLACLLLIGAGLMLHSLLNLLRSEPGFRPEHVLTASISLPEEGYTADGASSRFFAALLAELNTVPGVEAVGAATDLPWTGYDDNMGGWVVEGEKPPPNQEFHARYHAATPGFFQAVGIPLIKGRFFDDRDAKDSPKVLVINQAMARECWPHADAVGRRVSFDDEPKEKDWLTVIGVVGDVKDKPENAGAEPAFWWPHSQAGFPSLKIALRSRLETAALGGQLGRIVHRLDPALAVADIKSLDAIADIPYSTPRFVFFLIGLFAALALALACVGVYGVISYSVNLRQHEFAIRAAVGAKPWQVMRVVLGQGVRLAVLGALGGLLCGLALERVVGNVLYEVNGHDPLTFGVAVLAAIATAVLACYLPARRATLSDPMRALQAE